ncbi:hypothetical protein ILYODFUR_008877, partial [Ilyodon furcidens]
LFPQPSWALLYGSLPPPHTCLSTLSPPPHLGFLLEGQRAISFLKSKPTLHDICLSLDHPTLIEHGHLETSLESS